MGVKGTGERERWSHGKAERQNFWEDDRQQCLQIHINEGIGMGDGLY